MQTIYVTIDGEEFEDIEQAKCHEKVLQEREERLNKIKENQNKRYEEVQNAWKNFEKLRDEYYKDYYFNQIDTIKQLFHSFI